MKPQQEFALAEVRRRLGLYQGASGLVLKREHVAALVAAVDELRAEVERVNQRDLLAGMKETRA